MTEMRQTNGSQSLERGLAILSAFDSSRPLLGVSELGRAVGLSRSTTHRYVATLAQLGYLQQDEETRRYRLGPRVLELGFSAINSMELREISAPHLRRLSEQTGHTTNMSILDDTDIVYIERVRNPQGQGTEIDLDLHVGSRLPAYCTSMGKVLLAFQPTCRREELLAKIAPQQRGPNTLTDKRELAADLDRVRRRGFAVNNEELAYGLRSLAAPVHSQSGVVVAAINLSVHRSLATMEELVHELVPPLLRAADDISARIGFHGRRD
jgi:IclR family pca regulon transcriptional regulator